MNSDSAVAKVNAHLQMALKSTMLRKIWNWLWTVFLAVKLRRVVLWLQCCRSQTFKLIVQIITRLMDWMTRIMKTELTSVRSHSKQKNYLVVHYSLLRMWDLQWKDCRVNSLQHIFRQVYFRWEIWEQWIQLGQAFEWKIWLLQWYHGTIRDMTSMLAEILERSCHEFQDDHKKVNDWRDWVQDY